MEERRFRLSGVREVKVSGTVSEHGILVQFGWEKFTWLKPEMVKGKIKKGDVVLVRMRGHSIVEAKKKPRLRRRG